MINCLSLSLSLSLSYTDNSSVIAATATTSTTAKGSEQQQQQQHQPQQKQRFPKPCIKKVKFSSESLKADVDGLCEQLKESSVFNELNNFHINNINNNNNDIDNKYNNKMSEQESTTSGETTQASPTDGDRPSFLVIILNQNQMKLNYLTTVLFLCVTGG